MLNDIARNTPRDQWRRLYRFVRKTGERGNIAEESRMTTAQEAIEQYRNGLITNEEMHRALANLQK